jgi:nicotinate-nucleotide adenylyltransferase
VLGGTFDPPHLGHLIVASEARAQLGLDRVLLVPAGQPPHKPDGPTFPAELRLRLLAAAVAGEPGLGVSRIEVDRPGPSYTADTLEAIAAGEPGARLWFILGADQLVQLPGWRDPDRILAAARLAIAPRAGVTTAEAEARAASIAPGGVDWLDTPRIGISSSMVRDRMAAGRPIRWLVPPAVEEVLRGEGLVPS